MGRWRKLIDDCLNIVYYDEKRISTMHRYSMVDGSTNKCALSNGFLHQSLQILPQLLT